MGFRNIDHMDLVVSDVARAVDFYRRLGVQTGERIGGRGNVMQILKLGGGHESISLVTPEDLEAQGRKVLPGGGHVCVVWDGTMEEFKDHLSRSGIAPRYGQAQGQRQGEATGAMRSADGRANSNVFVVDPDNNLIEIRVYTE
jgi:catechol 2,3-dioxygenase-like lactoylglutathione lyase family enzyme